MFTESIREFFTDKKRIAQLKSERDHYRSELLQADLRAALPKPSLRPHPPVPIAGFDSLECEPTDSIARKSYIGEVDVFFESILKDKLRVTVGEIRNELAKLNSQSAHELGLTRLEYDSFMRGMEAMAWKMHDWCVTLQGERREVLQEQENNT